MQQSAGLDGLLGRAVTTGTRYNAEPNKENTTVFEDAVMSLLRALPSVDPTARLSLANHSVAELLSNAQVILSSTTTSASTRSKIHRLLFIIAMHNIRLRRYMAADLELCHPIFECLKRSLKEQLGPQNMIDILRLLQVLTYEKTIVLGLWTNDLISFLMSEVNREDEMEWMPYCITILCNLASRSKTVCSRIKRSSSFKVFCRKILKLLSHDSRVVVVSCLILVGYLDEKFRDMVYCPQNIAETFKCVFNVVATGDGDCLLTRQIASDLLKRLVVSDAPTVSSVPVITSTGKDVMNYPFFESSIQRVSELFVTLDPRIEESVKIYDLILSFCKLTQLRGFVCGAIIRTTPTESRLTTPILAVLKTASMSPSAAIDALIPIKAMRLLTLLCKEIIESNQSISSYLPPNQVIGIVANALKTSVVTSDEDATGQCELIVEGLKLAEVCSQEEDFRGELLNLASAALCRHIAEFQLLTNPIVVQMAKPPTQRVSRLPEWSVHGVSIVLELIRLLAALKDHSKPHKIEYWNSLKDDRLIPFIAFAIANGDHEMVHDALLLYTHCAQVQAFPTRLLGDLVASCTIAATHQSESKLSLSSSNLRENKRSSPDQMDYLDSKQETPPRYSPEKNRLLDDLLNNIRSGREIKDLKMSELMTAYEKKISNMEDRERELERVISSMERLRLQSKGSFSNEADMAKIRCLVVETEELVEKNKKLEDELVINKITGERKVKDLIDEIAKYREENDDLSSKLHKEKEHVLQALRHTEDQKKSLESASETLVEKGMEIEKLSKSVEHLKMDLLSLNRKYDQDIMKWRKENEELSGELEMLKSRGQKTAQDLDKLNRLREEMLRLANGYE